MPLVRKITCADKKVIYQLIIVKWKDNTEITLAVSSEGYVGNVVLRIIPFLFFYITADAFTVQTNIFFSGN